MKVEQLYTNCLAQAAYYIESNGEAAIVDPLRDIDIYLSKAARANARIRYIFETHFHADFVSGHLDLAKATGATIVYGPTAEPGFEALVAADEQIFTLGDISIKVLHTPGHTLESCCYLLYDESGRESMLFSGDTLFLGDVGRPDLAQKATNMNQEELAGLLYESLNTKIVPLPDHVIVYPGHGAGSACGKNLSIERYDVLGHQKKVNYALRSGLSKSDFVKEVTEGLTGPPQYFPVDVRLNKQGYKSITDIIRVGSTPLDVAAFALAAELQGAYIIDTRSTDDFASGFIPGSISISLDGDFAPWAGTVIKDSTKPILLICIPGKEEEAVIRLARVGYDNTIGYLPGGIEAWKASGKEVDTIQCISPEELADRLEEMPVAVLLDVRKKSEYDAEHVIGAENVPLNYIDEEIGRLDKDTTYYVYCAAGYRSMIFCSYLKAYGFSKLINIKGGFKDIKVNGRLFLSQYAAPASML
jgi:hydroxyacylglutathione hydrolase